MGQVSATRVLEDVGVIQKNLPRFLKNVGDFLNFVGDFIYLSSV